jgi:hypothetical protein
MCCHRSPAPPLCRRCAPNKAHRKNIAAYLLLPPALPPTTPMHDLCPNNNNDNNCGCSRSPKAKDATSPPATIIVFPVKSPPPVSSPMPLDDDNDDNDNDNNDNNDDNDNDDNNDVNDDDDNDPISPSAIVVVVPPPPSLPHVVA